MAGCRVGYNAAGNPMLCFDLRSAQSFAAACPEALREALDGTRRDHGTPVAINLAVFNSPGLPKISRTVAAATGNRVVPRPR